MNLFSKTRELLGVPTRQHAVAATPGPAGVDRPNLTAWTQPAAEFDAHAWERAVDEVAKSLTVEQARAEFEQRTQRLLRVAEREHDDVDTCGECSEAIEADRAHPWEETAQRIEAVERVMKEHDPLTVSAYRAKFHAAASRATEAREQLIARTARGMSFGEAEGLLRRQDFADHVDERLAPDSRDLAAARRVIAVAASTRSRARSRCRSPH